MTYSYTQLSQYLRCPRGYRHRYLDGWREKEDRAALLFGRCFEKALAAYFLRQDSAAVLFKEWGNYRDTPLEHSNGDSWDRMAHQGVQLLERLARDDRIRICQPRRNLQAKLVRALPHGNDFVAYIDAIGKLDGIRCLLDWKTTRSRYPEEPTGLLALDPQANLLLLDERHLGCGCSGIRAQTDARDPVPADFHHRRAASGVLPVG